MSQGKMRTNWNLQRQSEAQEINSMYSLQRNLVSFAMELKSTWPGLGEVVDETWQNLELLWAQLLSHYNMSQKSVTMSMSCCSQQVPYTDLQGLMIAYILLALNLTLSSLKAHPNWETYKRIWRSSSN